MNNIKILKSQKIDNLLFQFEHKLSEAEEDIRNEKLYDMKSVMFRGLNVLERKLNNYSIEEQEQALEFINEMRNQFE